jgi:hypothetical protein
MFHQSYNRINIHSISNYPQLLSTNKNNTAKLLRGAFCRMNHKRYATSTLFTSVASGERGVENA